MQNLKVCDLSVYCATVPLPVFTQMTALCSKVCHLKAKDVTQLAVSREKKGQEVDV